ncbi:hypothetical protein TrRE_jg2802, partial [Triparma retinervis]
MVLRRIRIAAKKRLTGAMPSRTVSGKEHAVKKAASRVHTMTKKVACAASVRKDGMAISKRMEIRKDLKTPAPLAVKTRTYRTGTEVDKDECSRCEKGTYSTNGASRCFFASAGNVAKPDGTGEVACRAGTYSSDGKGCQTCSGVGEFSGAGASFCKKALVGTKPNEDHSGVELCPPNSYSVGGADKCIDCEEGFWSTPGSSNCSPCRPGHEFDALAAKREMIPCFKLKTNATNTKSRDDRVLSIFSTRTSNREASVHFREHHNITTAMVHEICLAADEIYRVEISGTTWRGSLDWALVGGNGRGVVAVMHNITSRLETDFTFALPPVDGWCRPCEAGKFSSDG